MSNLDNQGSSKIEVAGSKKGRQFFDEHMDYIAKNDIDGMLDKQYHEDAVLVTFFDYKDTPPPHVIKGREELKKFFEEYLATLGFIELTKMSEVAETEDMILFQASFNCKLGERRVSDGWYLKEGKILRHFGSAL